MKFLFAARPSFDRGLWLLLQAWERWQPDPEQARLLVFTHREGARSERTVASINSRRETVELHYGLLSKDRLLALHRQIHFVINPAVWEEPGSATVGEALLLGTPCIVPTSTGSSDFIIDGANGYTFSFRNTDDLVGTLERAVANRADWSLLHEGALRTGEELRRSSVRSLVEMTKTLLPGFSPTTSNFDV
jgi:glycosyltransferase involved in cell wall biosynthesis